MRNKFLIALIIFDQITKAVLADRDFFPPLADPPLAGFLRIGLVKNFGLPFAIQSSGTISTVIALIIFLCLFAYYLYNHKSFQRNDHIAFALIIAGAVSNIIDRLALGYVRDYFDFGLGFVFNLADAYIVLGIILVFFNPFRGSSVNGGKIAQSNKN